MIAEIAEFEEMVVRNTIIVLRLHYTSGAQHAPIALHLPTRSRQQLHFSPYPIRSTSVTSNNAKHSPSSVMDQSPGSISRQEHKPGARWTRRPQHQTHDSLPDTKVGAKSV